MNFYLHPLRFIGARFDCISNSKSYRHFIGKPIYLSDSEYPIFPLMCGIILWSSHAIVWEFVAQERDVIGRMLGYQPVEICTEDGLRGLMRVNEAMIVVIHTDD